MSTGSDWIGEYWNLFDPNQLDLDGFHGFSSSRCTPLS